MSNRREGFKGNLPQESQSPSSSVPLFQRLESRFDVPRTERQKRRLPAVPMTAELRSHFEGATQHQFRQPWLSAEVAPTQGPQPFLELDAERRAMGIELQPPEVFNYPAEAQQAVALFAELPTFTPAEPEERVLPQTEVEERVSLAWQIFQSLVHSFSRFSAEKHSQTA